MTPVPHPTTADAPVDQPASATVDQPASGSVDQAASGSGAAAALVRHLASAVNSELGLAEVLQTVTDYGTKLSGARFGAFFYNAVDEQGAPYQLHVLSGSEDDLAPFAVLPPPGATTLFAATFAQGETVLVDDYATDPRSSHLPAAHPPLRSYLATPVIGRGRTAIGALLFGHPEPGVFTAASRDVVELVAAHAAVAVENAELVAA